MSRWRLQEGDKMTVAFWALNRKLNPRLTWTHAIDGVSRLERSEAPVPWPAEEQEDENPQLRPSEEKATRPLSRSRRRLSLCRVKEKRRRHYICRLVRFVSALLVWVRRRHQACRH
ncbi:hypothetical protein Taro_019444 [Colocasia esculenta]|uniref:Uncharacterized protein n=1 Tax=Colocasia esculenta TaxID=4460 RepID=A0A843V280_COLES|nr:hypothetical protein [Colocasia esculenta]